MSELSTKQPNIIPPFDQLSVLPMPDSPLWHDDESSLWGYTKGADELALLRQEQERLAGRRERHTIGRDRVISEGVYEGYYGGEAIVVDYDNAPELIDRAVAEVTRRSWDPKTQKVDKSKILGSVFNVVKESMLYDKTKVDEIFSMVLGGQDAKKISLSYYIKEGRGVCRHQALYAGVVLEKLKAAGYITGQVSVDRNMVRRKSDMDDKYDGHAWVRYTNSAEQVIILDIAQNKALLLDEAIKLRQKDPQSTWDYAREEDKHQADEKRRNMDRHKTHPYDPKSYTDENGVIYRLPWDNNPR